MKPEAIELPLFGPDTAERREQAPAPREQKERIADAPLPDRRYVAGIVDGEGSISLVVSHKRTRGTWEIMTEVTVSNRHLPLLRSIQAAYGGTIRPVRNKRRTIGKLVWERHADIRALLVRLAPHLRVKRAQAALMLDYLAARGAGHRARYTEADWARADCMAVLNARSRYPGERWQRPTERRRREEGR